MSTVEVGDLLYEYTVKFTKIIEYGAALQPLLTGEAAPPPEGARFDVAFEGAVTGPKFKGSIAGVDYLQVRADGRFQLHIHAQITTDEADQIALFADGVVLKRKDGSIADLLENVTLFTSSRRYAWVNPLQVWATGTVDLAEQVVRVRGYSAFK